MCKWAIQNGCGGDQDILFVCEVEPVSVCVFSYVVSIASFLSRSKFGSLVFLFSSLILLFLSYYTLVRQSRI